MTTLKPPATLKSTDYINKLIQALETDLEQTTEVKQAIQGFKDHKDHIDNSDIYTNLSRVYKSQNKSIPDWVMDDLFESGFKMT